jgi:hypothetical protein
MYLCVCCHAMLRCAVLCHTIRRVPLPSSSLVRSHLQAAAAVVAAPAAAQAAAVAAEAVAAQVG